MSGPTPPKNRYRAASMLLREATLLDTDESEKHRLLVSEANAHALLLLAAALDHDNVLGLRGEQS